MKESAVFESCFYHPAEAPDLTVISQRIKDNIQALNNFSKAREPGRWENSPYSPSSTSEFDRSIKWKVVKSTFSLKQWVIRSGNWMGANVHKQGVMCQLSGVVYLHLLFAGPELSTWTSCNETFACTTVMENFWWRNLLNCFNWTR